ncbi:hypothetical protein, partial [Anabaena azotica]|uniref:hypothetical protein n=1 Tax=Anabaena azotica TaxID=197653 RepID=UPI001A7EDE63
APIGLRFRPHLQCSSVQAIAPCTVKESPCAIQWGDSQLTFPRKWAQLAKTQIPGFLKKSGFFTD